MIQEWQMFANWWSWVMDVWRIIVLVFQFFSVFEIKKKNSLKKNA